MRHHPKGPRDQLDVLLEASDPVDRSAPAGDDVERVLNEIGAAITARSRRPSPVARRRRLARSRTALVLGAAVVALGAAVAAGAVLTAHTGLFPTKAERRWAARARH